MNTKFILIVTAGIVTHLIATDTIQETSAITMLSALLGIPEPALASESTLRDYVCTHAHTTLQQSYQAKLIDTMVRCTMALKETLEENIHLFASANAKNQRFYVLNKGTKFNILIEQEPEPAESSLLSTIGSIIWKAAGLVGSCIFFLGLPKTNTITFNGWQYVSN